MLEELSEELNSISKDPVGNEDTLIEIKNNLQETTVEWMKPRIKSMIWNIQKQKTIKQSKKKKKRTQKSEDSVSSL